MQATTEFEIRVSGGKIKVPKDLPDGVYSWVMEVETPTVSEQCRGFVRIPASELSLEEDWFRKFNPLTREEKIFYEQVEEVLKEGVRDFYRPTLDPSFKEDGTGICYVPYKQPAVNKDFEWWNTIAKSFNPELRSRLGTKSEYVAFLAVLIKNLVGSGWKLENAWSAVCNDSRELGNFRNSENSKNSFEKTGRRKICGFFDLGNTHKILGENENHSGFWRVGGYFHQYGKENPLSFLANFPYHGTFYNRENSTGWLVLEENPN